MSEAIAIIGGAVATGAIDIFIDYFLKGMTLYTFGEGFPTAEDLLVFVPPALMYVGGRRASRGGDTLKNMAMGGFAYGAALITRDMIKFFINQQGILPGGASARASAVVPMAMESHHLPTSTSYQMGNAGLMI